MEETKVPYESIHHTETVDWNDIPSEKRYLARNYEKVISNFNIKFELHTLDFCRMKRLHKDGSISNQRI